jgi:transcriptional regulator with XRE-family HTH domain
MPDVQTLFEEFAARYRAGETPDACDYVERAGDTADELAMMIAIFLEVVPPPEVSETALARILQFSAFAALGEAEFATALTEMRKQRGETRASFSRSLAEALGVAHKSAKVKRYYADLENGLLCPAGLHRRVVRALADLLGVPESHLDAARSVWRPRRPDLVQAAYLRTEKTLRDVPSKPEEPTEGDEVDDLFVGGV